MSRPANVTVSPLPFFSTSTGKLYHGKSQERLSSLCRFGFRELVQQILQLVAYRSFIVALYAMFPQRIQNTNRWYHPINKE